VSKTLGGTFYLRDEANNHLIVFEVIDEQHLRIGVDENGDDKFSESEYLTIDLSVFDNQDGDDHNDDQIGDDHNDDQDHQQSPVTLQSLDQASFVAKLTANDNTKEWFEAKGEEAVCHNVEVNDTSPMSFKLSLYFANGSDAHATNWVYSQLNCQGTLTKQQITFNYSLTGTSVPNAHKLELVASDDNQTLTWYGLVGISSEDDLVFAMPENGESVVEDENNLPDNFDHYDLCKLQNN
jgi:hypothetical protein